MHLFRNFALLAIMVLVVGCRATFRHEAPAARLNPSGPSIVVTPLIDSRSDRSLDKAIKSGYTFEMQQAIVNELRGMNCFSEVRSGSASSEPVADLILTAELHELEWEVPEYKKKLGEAVAMGAMFGAVGGGIYLSTGTDVTGFCKLGVRVETTSAPKRTFKNTYLGAVSERRSKATSDTSKAKATMASLSFQNALKKMKTDLAPQVRGYKKVSAIN